MFKKRPKLITFIAVLIIVVGSLVVWLINSGQSAPEAVAGWYDEGWLYRQQLVVDSTKINLGSAIIPGNDQMVPSFQGHFWYSKIFKSTDCIGLHPNSCTI